MTPKGGARVGAGRKPASVTGRANGRRANVYLNPANAATWDSLPARMRSKYVNEAMEQKREGEGMEKPVMKKEIAVKREMSETVCKHCGSEPLKGECECEGAQIERLTAELAAARARIAELEAAQRGASCR